MSFLAEIVFYSGKRKSLPANGYRPDAFLYRKLKGNIWRSNMIYDEINKLIVSLESSGE